MPSSDPDDRVAVARIAAHESWARTPDRSARTAPARAASDARFEALVDPDGVLAPEVRARMVESARSAHYARLARRSVQVRAQRRAAAAGGAAPPASRRGSRSPGSTGTAG